MKRAPQFRPYPLTQPPVYGRWVTAGAALLALVSSASVLLGPLVEARQAVLAVVLTVGLWLVVLLLRVLHHRFNIHNAGFYDQAVQDVQQRWWRWHRRQVGLLEAVLLGAQCVAPHDRTCLLDPENPLPEVESVGGGKALRVAQVGGTDVTEREQQLAVLLAVQWQLQAPDLAPCEVQRCYWLGSRQAWQAFVEQMMVSNPQVRLPAHPMEWEGIRSLDAIIDELHGGPEQTYVMCAGCESSIPSTEPGLPAGEAAFLWLLAPKASVSLGRGEWFKVGAEPLKAVAARALQQVGLQAPPAARVSFLAAETVDADGLGWGAGRHLLDARFGALPVLGAMVVQTLAAWHAAARSEPCGWLADDPHYTLALGVVTAND